MLLVNVCLYLAAIALPFGLVLDWIIFSVVVLLIWLCFGLPTQSSLFKHVHPSEGIFIAVIPPIITLWCRDVLRPIELNEGDFIIRAWSDIYYHLAQIETFASSKGLGSISDVAMVGAPVHPYHHASYIVPALLVKATSCSALVAYASFLVPVGLLLTALAAYSLASSVFGKYPALAAGMALVLLPDALQQGVGNSFFGYQWLQQVGPAGCYGVASAAVAFMLLLDSCRNSSLRVLAWGYIFVAFTLMFKAQIFVAISYLAFIFPALFFKWMPKKNRLVLLVVLTVVYVGVTVGSQALSSVPVIRLDGSSLADYSSLVLSMQADGVIKSVMTAILGVTRGNWFFGGVAFALMLTICTFGLFPILYLVLWKSLRAIFQPMVCLFPVLVVLIYLVMGTSLALDDRHIGMPEELLHRPFVWAYFVLVVWIAAATYYRLFGDAPPVTRSLKWMLMTLIPVMTLVPVYFGHGIQTNKGCGLSDFTRLPESFLEVTNFIRVKSNQDDVVQDSGNDRHFMLSALSERKPFAIDCGGFRQPVGLPARLLELQNLKNLHDTHEVDAFMKKNMIKWYVTHQGDHVQWATAMMERVAFESGGYRVYRF